VSEPDFYIGLISGTSRDGVDAVLVSFDGERPQLHSALCLPYPPATAQRLERLLQAGRRPRADEAQSLDPEVASHFADAALRLLRESDLEAGRIRAIGSHGQTVWHDPDGPIRETIQLGHPSLIAQRTGICTVGDFRRADIEAGGQGAPLAPLLHRALFRPERGNRVVLNLGGIANISILDADGRVAGFDTGPANCLLDAWAGQELGRAFDEGGQWAAGGRADSALLHELLHDPWFARLPPKSTGTEYFNLRWLQCFLGERAIAARDVQATLVELTAVSVAEAVLPCNATDVLLCGGGSHNDYLVARLATRLQGVRLGSTAECGLDPDWVEAVLFAWLARERLAGRLQDTAAITGAHAPVLLGSVAYPPAVE
jgi:anhydro-N-acetylmuramic acid kinase